MAGVDRRWVQTYNTWFCWDKRFKTFAFGGGRQYKTALNLDRTCPRIVFTTIQSIAIPASTTPTTTTTSTTTSTTTPAPTTTVSGACEFNPCSNGGLCYKVKGHFTCVCPPGYTGVVCQEGEIHSTILTDLFKILMTFKVPNQPSTNWFYRMITGLPFSLLSTCLSNWLSFYIYIPAYLHSCLHT